MADATKKVSGPVAAPRPAAAPALADKPTSNRLSAADWKKVLASFAGTAMPKGIASDERATLLAGLSPEDASKAQNVWIRQFKQSGPDAVPMMGKALALEMAKAPPSWGTLSTPATPASNSSFSAGATPAKKVALSPQAAPLSAGTLVAFSLGRDPSLAQTRQVVEDMTRTLSPADKDLVLAKVGELIADGRSVEKTDGDRFAANLALELSEDYGMGRPFSPNLEQFFQQMIQGNPVFDTNSAARGVLETNCAARSHNLASDPVNATSATAPGAPAVPAPAAPAAPGASAPNEEPDPDAALDAKPLDGKSALVGNAAQGAKAAVDDNAALDDNADNAGADSKQALNADPALDSDDVSSTSSALTAAPGAAPSPGAPVSPSSLVSPASANPSAPAASPSPALAPSSSPSGSAASPALRNMSYEDSLVAGANALVSPEVGPEALNKMTEGQMIAYQAKMQAHARLVDMYSKLLQAQNDMKKGIIANFRV
jgi:hypothetical protein